MSGFPYRRLAPDIIEADEAASAAVTKLIDFNPPNPTYHTGLMAEKLNAMQAARDAELHAANQARAARDAAVQAEWEFHDVILNIKPQVIGQYGANSDAVQSLGLKKKSARKRPTGRSRRTKSNDNQS